MSSTGVGDHFTARHGFPVDPAGSARPARPARSLRSPGVSPPALL